MNFFTKTEADYNLKYKKNWKNYGKHRWVGVFYDDMFKNEADREFKESMPMFVVITWLLTGFSGYVDSAEFPKRECPCCGKETLVPYSCGGSGLSGTHMIRFHCLNCKERIAFNNIKDYFHLIRDYCLKNRDKMKNDRVYVKLKGKQRSLNAII